MELQDLVGEHLLDAVDCSDEQVMEQWGDGFEQCQVMRFRLDGKCYTAIENPEDGYRSTMREISVSDTANMKNVFPPVKVVARYCDKDEDYTNDILELIDVQTGKMILEVGTRNTDDYYPWFVANFYLEDMVHNAK